MSGNKIEEEYKRSQTMQALFCQYGTQSSLPLTFQDSISPVPDHPFCAFGVLTAEGDWGSTKGIAFVVEENYLLTCASNCYSHQHGQFSRISFSINTNTKSGYNTYKVIKAFIPKQYKTLPYNKRSQHNYALLQVQGKMKMKDMYGSIGMQFQGIEQKGLSFLECFMNNLGLLQYYREHKMTQNISMLMSGTPLLFQTCFGIKIAVGLVFSQDHNSQLSFMLFNRDMYSQLAQWVQIPVGRLSIGCSSVNELDARCLRYEKIRPVQRIQIHDFKVDGETCLSFFNQLPFSTVNRVALLYNQIGNDLRFLKLKKFKDLKELQLKHNQIGSQGCQIISKISLSNLRILSLENNPIGNEGCKNLSTTKWPFLSNLYLNNCQIGNEGLGSLCQMNWRNLCHLVLRSNQIDSDISPIIQAAYTHRIIFFDISSNNLDGSSLRFLKFPSWKSICQLKLSHCSIGNKGCKIIKKANFALTSLFLSCCSISSLGIRWLCKANLSKVFWLELSSNSLADEDCFELSRTNLSCIQELDLRNNLMRAKGVKKLLQAQWVKQAISDNNSLYKLVKSLGKAELVDWIQI